MTASVPVCLVNMPFSGVARPSLALGLLKSALQGAGIPTRVDYANLHFASRAGLDRHQMVDDSVCFDLVGEWIFAQAAFPEHESDAAAYLARIFNPNWRTFLDAAPESAIAHLWSMRRQAAAFVDETARRVLSQRPRVVGCSSTFHQHCASLALFRRIRELEPDVVTVLGGSNCEGPMGRVTAECFPWVDVVVSGEADQLVVPLCRRLIDEGRAACRGALPQGVMTAGTGRATRATMRDMSTLPLPDYDEYFETLRALGLDAFVSPSLVVETSRGCWWGEKHHCTFCGVNGENMAYRAKSGTHALEEFDALSRRYGVRSFYVADNILDMKYFKTLLPALADRPYEIFYEVKANLKRAQVEALKRGGVTWIQPGLESLNDDILNLMEKGTTAAQNVQLLRWAREFGVDVTWTMLTGFPGERAESYADMAAWLPCISHLQPPRRMANIIYERFSPYHQRPASFGLELAPRPAYADVFPLDAARLADLAYYFVDTRSRAVGDDLAGARAEVGRCISAWVRAFHRPLPTILSVQDDGKALRFIDTRPVARSRSFEVDGLARRIYLACNEAPSRATLGHALADVRPAAVDEALDDLIARRLLLVLSGRYVALAVAGSLPTLPDRRRIPGGNVDLDAYRRQTVPRVTGSDLIAAEKPAFSAMAANRRDVS